MYEYITKALVLNNSREKETGDLQNKTIHTSNTNISKSRCIKITMLNLKTLKLYCTHS